MRKVENIWAKWALSAEQSRELFEAMRVTYSFDREEELYEDDDADCVYD